MSMRAPNRTEKVMRGLVAMADNVELKGPLHGLGHRVNNDADHALWTAMVRAAEWIRKMDAFDAHQRGEKPSGCIGDT
jgi:hypothetical protein